MARVGYTNLGTTHRLELHLSQNSQSVTNNTSVVGYTLQIVRISSSAGGYWNNNSSTGALTINGTAISVPSFTYDFRSNYTKVLATGSITVAHNADGTKTVASSASVTMNTAGLIPSGSVSGSLALTTIPRASSFTIPASYTMGNAFTATITRASSAFTHNITVKYGNLTLLSGTGYGTSASLTINHTALYNATSTVTSAVLTVTMNTISGGVVIGTSSKNITANNGTRPTFTTVTHSDSNATQFTRFGAYIQSKSRVALAITGAAASTGATIKSYRITVDGQVLNAASGTTLPIKGSGSLTATGTVTDSRGFSISKSVTLSVLAYTPPAITSVSLQRVNSAGVNDDYGTYAKFILGYKVTPLGNKNGVSTKVKIGSSDTWAPQTLYTGTYTVQYSGFNVNNAYNAEFIVADYFGSTISPQVLPTGAVTMMWGRDWISVGTAEGKGSGTLNVAKEIYSKGDRMGGVEKTAPKNLNDATRSGSYRLSSGHTNAPPASDWSQMQVIYGGGDSITQLMFPYANDEIWRRSGNPPQVNGSGAWRPWTRMAKSTDIPATPADYVVEQGSNYTKWNSGKLEMWGSEVTNVESGSVRSKSVTFPVPFNTTSYHVQLTNNTSAVANIMQNGFTRTSTSVMTVSIFRSTAGTVGFSWYAIGNWK